MKKMVKIMAIVLLLGLTGSDVYGMKRQFTDKDADPDACADPVEQSAEKRREHALSEVNLSDMPYEILENIFVQNTIDLLRNLKFLKGTSEVSLSNHCPKGHGPCYVRDLIDQMSFNSNLINLIGEICRYRSICRRVQDFLSDEEVLKILQYAGLNLNRYNLHDLLSEALNKGFPCCIKVLIRAGAKVNEIPRDVEYRCSLLHEAVRDEKVECIKVLVRAGANIKAFDSDGISVLEYAAVTGNVEVLNTLIALSKELNLRLNVNDRDLFDGTALHWAIIGTLPNCPNFLRRLLELGANPAVYSCYTDEFLKQYSISDLENVKYEVYGQTPLHFAVMLGNKIGVQILVDHYLRNRLEIPEDLKPQLREMGFRFDK